MMSIDKNDYILLDNLEKMFLENDLYNENESNELFENKMLRDVY